MTLPIELLEKPKSQISPELVDSIKEELDEGKKICLGITLSRASREVVIQKLKNRITTFTWKAEDIKGVDLAIISHRLNVDPEAKPV